MADETGQSESVPESTDYVADETAQVVDETYIDVARELRQMRGQVVGLGTAVLVVSLAFGVFVWKQNKALAAENNLNAQRIEQFRSTQSQWMPALNELASYSVANPELKAIFAKYGVQVGPAQPAPGQAPGQVAPGAAPALR